MSTKYEAGEYILNGVTYKLTGSQMQAMAVMNMPSLDKHYKGYAVTGNSTDLPEHYEGRNGHHHSQNPTIHHRTARALADVGLVTLEHSIWLRQFTIHLVKETAPPCSLCGQTVYMSKHFSLGWTCSADGNIN